MSDLPGETIIHSVTLIAANDSQVSFPCPEGRSIYNAAYAAGYYLTIGCAQARCTICRSEILRGQVKSTRAPSKFACDDPASRDDGCVLICSTTPVEDVVLRPRSAWSERGASIGG